jgi:hypothetical protein
MKKLAFITLLFHFGIVSAQTKVIAHKSHSGNSNNFSKAYQQNMFDIRNSNFGLPGNATIYLLDTVVALNDTTTIVYRRESIVCYEWGTDYKKLKKNDFKTIKDTLINSQLLNPRNSVAYIIKNHQDMMIWNEVYFQNPIQEVVFIGFRPNDQWIENCRPAPRDTIKKVR